GAGSNYENVGGSADHRVSERITAVPVRWQSLMRIVNFETFHLRSPSFSRPLQPAWSPGTSWSSRGAVIVKFATDEGIVGWGAPGYGGTPLIESWIKPQLMGTDPFNLEQHARVFRGANGGWGVEIALWDIIGKATGQPLCRLWGGHSDRVTGYASCVELRSGEQRAQDALARRDEGWRAIKLRLHDWTIREDLAQVAAVRRTRGDDFTIL